MSLETPLEAAVVTVGSELVDGLRLDTNTRAVAAALTAHGWRVREALSIGDDTALLGHALRRLVDAFPLVVVTGGLGPTHDDITRDAAALALDTRLAEDPSLRAALERIADRHADPRAAAQVFRQALVLPGAQVIPAESGTAPGQIVPTPAGRLILLPGPPHEMTPMLDRVLAGEAAAPTRVLGCAGISESDAQLRAQDALASHPGVDLTVLATPGQVQVVLTARDALSALDAAVEAVTTALGDDCYAADGDTLAAAVLTTARSRGATLGTAESCTGGMVAAALTDVPGSSDVFQGSVVAYAEDIKVDLLGVDRSLLARHGAVSAPVAEMMASGLKERLGCTLAIATTGIAGPGGGTLTKPVGLVWFAVADGSRVRSFSRNLFGDRYGVRERATVVALDALRRALADDHRS